MLQKKLVDDMKTQGRLQRINPFKEIDGKEYNKKHNNKQKELLEKFSKEIQQGKILGGIQQHQRRDGTEEGIQQQNRFRTIPPPREQNALHSRDERFSERYFG